jgi:RES domain-containing protein
MSGRFDLPAPLGTCYLASDPLSALLELIGVDRKGGAVAAEFLAERRLRELRTPREFTLADLASRRAAGFGITSEIGTLVPYEQPQAWAASLQGAGFQGLVYWLRHDPSRGEGWALFGPAGERRSWRRGCEVPISHQLVERLRAECGVEVVRIPKASELTILDDHTSLPQNLPPSHP